MTGLLPLIYPKKTACIGFQGLIFAQIMANAPFLAVLSAPGEWKAC